MRSGIKVHGQSIRSRSEILKQYVGQRYTCQTGGFGANNERQ